MEFKDHTLEFLKGRLQSLEEELAVAQNQLDVELEFVNQTKLERRIEGLLQKIEACEQEVRDRQHLLTQQATRLATSELIQILQAHDNHLGSMQETFQSLLNRRSYPPNASIQTAEGMVNELLRYPKGSFSCRALDEFVACLVILAEDAVFLTALQTWGERYISEWAELLGQVKQAQEQAAQNAEPLLLVSLRRSDEHSTQAQDGPYYQIRTVLIYDQHHYRKAQQGYRPVHLPETTGDEAYRWDELPQTVPRLLAHCLAEASTLSSQEPEIHVFLPMELMNDAIDQWCPQVGYGRPQPIGGKYNVVLRCAERVSRSYIHKPLWLKRWRQQQALCEAIALNTFVPGNDADLDELYDALEDLEDEIVGLKVTQVPGDLNPDGLFGAILQAGLPLAIWSRCELSESAVEAELDRLLSQDCLMQLPRTVRNERRAARKAKKDCHIGHHLSLLWDDPDLIPPKSA